MPSYRIGFGSDFNLRDAKVGIGTTLGRTKLDVAGVSKADFNIAGVSTLTSYGGFVGQKQNVSVASTIGFSTSGVGTFVSVDESETGYLNLSGDFNTVSEDIIVDEGKIFQVSSGSTVSVGTLESVSIGTHFSVPNGGISVRPDEPREGMVRFNDDLNTLEFYNGVEWRQFTVTGASGRALTGGGSVGEIDVFNISTTGNATAFANFLVLRTNTGACASSTRGIFAGGYAPASPTSVNIIEYVTIASSGNSIDFGDMTRVAWNPATTSSSTRGIFAGGFPGFQNTIDYITIATIGNAIDFGDLFGGRYGATAFASPTRGLFAGQDPAGAPFAALIDFITIASTGNAVKFGDLTQIRRYALGCSNSTRGLVGGGGNPASINAIDYVTIASTGNAIRFGDLTVARQYNHSGAASNIRATFPGGSSTNVIDYVTIATTGNAIDFGDLTVTTGNRSSLSDSHGGLGGF